MSADGDVLLAYEMNGETLPRDHGYPYASSSRESPALATRNGSRAFACAKRKATAFGSAKTTNSSPRRRAPKRSTTPKRRRFKKRPSNQRSPSRRAEVTSTRKTKWITVRGYAFSGGGRGIDRVDVTIDRGRTWRRVAELDSGAGIVRRLNRNWALTLWEDDVPISAESSGSLVIACRAVDSANTQPEKGEHVWNFQGLLNNSWHRVEVNVKGSEN